MSIGNRVDEAIVKLLMGDFENSLIQISIAIDATSKKKYGSKLGVGKRIRVFVDEHEHLIRHFSMSGRLQLYTQEGVYFSDKGTLADIVYKSIRCALLHEGDISKTITFERGEIHGMRDGKFIATDLFLWGLILILIGEPCNKEQQLKTGYYYTFNGSSYYIHRLWGEMEYLKAVSEYPEPPAMLTKL